MKHMTDSPMVVNAIPTPEKIRILILPSDPYGVG